MGTSTDKYMGSESVTKSFTIITWRPQSYRIPKIMFPSKCQGLVTSTDLRATYSGSLDVIIVLRVYHELRVTFNSWYRNSNNTSSPFQWTLVLQDASIFDLHLHPLTGGCIHESKRSEVGNVYTRRSKRNRVFVKTKGDLELQWKNFQKVPGIKSRIKIPRNECHDG